jgi:hypothetical protein
MLDLSSDGSISVIYPTEAGTQLVLKPGLKVAKTLTTSVPKGRSMVTDILKVFASYKPIDLTPLTQGTIRGIEEREIDPLEALLTDAAVVSRGVSPVLGSQTGAPTWNTVERVLLVKRKSP